MASVSDEARDSDAGPEEDPLLNQLLAKRKEFLRFVERRVGRPQAAEEILQSAYLKAVEKTSALRDGERVVAWFYRLIRNAIVDHYRRQGAEERALAGVAMQPSPTGGRDAELELEVCRCASVLIGELRPEYRHLLQRVDLEEEDIGEVAAALEITRNNATVRLHRARGALRQRLIDFCGTCTEHGCLNCGCAPPRKIEGTEGA